MHSVVLFRERKSINAVRKVQGWHYDETVQQEDHQTLNRHGVTQVCMPTSVMNRLAGCDMKISSNLMAQVNIRR